MKWASSHLLALAMCSAFWGLMPVGISRGQEPRNYPYFELEGTAEDYRFIRDWRHYYWRDDFTMLVRDDAGKVHRVISREPTPWSGYRLGTTYPALTVDWTKKPRVRLIGVKAVDRVPLDFYDVKLDPDNTMTAFIGRVQTGQEGGKPVWRDFYVNNWFHRWGPETDRKMLPHYANDDPNYTVYGYLNGIGAPFDEESKKLLEKCAQTHGSLIYHGRVVKADNEVGYAVRFLHLLGRNKKNLTYEACHGDPQDLVKLDGKPPVK